MKTPTQVWTILRQKIKKEWKLAFMTVLVLGILVHMSVMIGDYPNHDGLASMYFDQNMITSGRWFLGVACGISSYYAIPWVIGVLSLIFLGIGAAALVDFLEIHEPLFVILISGLLVTFPALASTYAYIFTADGYMMGLGLAFLAVALTKKWSLGFLPGGICLAFSMGIYQSYLPFAMILSVYGCIQLFMEADSRNLEKNKALAVLKDVLHYLYMGIIGVGLYYLLLQILLKIQGKVLDTYQGINGMASAEGASVKEMLAAALGDFVAFTGKGNVLYNNMLSGVALTLLVLITGVLFIRLMVVHKWYRKWYFYVLTLVVVGVLPFITNVILFISPSVTYHLLMRYQWILYPILMLAFVVRYGFRQTEITGACSNGLATSMQWIAVAAAFVLIVNYAVTDNIAYANLQKKYEKTYAYTLRMIDRMEQTEGYYTGIPVAMIGVQNQENLPQTDITGDVTSGMIGMTGDYLIYTDTNYQAFMKNYLGVTLELVPDEEMERIYLTPEYQELNSFPQEGCMKVVDGILYIKTE